MMQSFLQRYQKGHEENKIIMFTTPLLWAKPGDDILSHIHTAGTRIVLHLYLAYGAAVPGDSDFFFLNQVTELVVKG